MLSSLSIQDFVIVDRLDLHFEAGMTVLSGETGAGKSILIDALSLCLGARAEASVVRQGCERAQITATFGSSTAISEILHDQSLPIEDELHLRRAIDASGKSKAFVNGVSVPAATLKLLAEVLIDIHGQHAFQTLGKPQEQLRLLDEFGQHQIELQAVTLAWKDYAAADKKLRDARASQEDREGKLQALGWQIETLQALAPKTGEWEQLNLDHDRLSHGAELIEGAQWAQAALTEADHNLIDQLNEVLHKISWLSNRDPGLNNAAQNLTEAEILLREAAHELQAYSRTLDLDPETLAALQQRLSQWHETSRKLRIPPPNLSEHLEQLEIEFKSLSNMADLSALETQTEQARAVYLKQAKELSQKRKASATALAKRVTASMQELNMQGGVLEIKLREVSASIKGTDEVEFLVAGHPGVTPQPLGKVASGGELARISLAITVNTVSSTPVPTLIFDEVDSGIGGAVAETVGKYLRRLASDKQVLCVTHLPQVAAQGHHHYKVAKSIEAGSTRSRIDLLNEEQRISEVARMLGGQTITASTRQSASEMITAATQG